MSRVLSINVGKVEPLGIDDPKSMSAILKMPIAGPARFTGVIIEGDEVGNPRVHGGYDNAVYSYASEDYAWWSERLGRPLEPGTFGENLTTEGIDLNAAIIGERWRLGDVVLEVSAPRFPCSTFQTRMGIDGWVRQFSEAERPGTYLRIIVEGECEAGVAIQVVDRPDHGMTVREFFRLYTIDRPNAGVLLGIPHVAEKVKERIREFLKES